MVEKPAKRKNWLGSAFSRLLPCIRTLLLPLRGLFFLKAPWDFLDVAAGAGSALLAGCYACWVVGVRSTAWGRASLGIGQAAGARGGLLVS